MVGRKKDDVRGIVLNFSFRRSGGENRLRFIHHALKLGFEVDAVRELRNLTEQPQRSYTKGRIIGIARAASIEDRCCIFQESLYYLIYEQ